MRSKLIAALTAQHAKCATTNCGVAGEHLLEVIEGFDGGCEVMPRQADVDMVCAVLSEMYADLQGDFGFGLTPPVIHRLYGVLVDSAPYAKSS